MEPERLGPDTDANNDMLTVLLNCCPLDEERTEIEGFTGDKAKLGPVETFMLRLLAIPKIESRLQCMVLLLNFEISISVALEHIEEKSKQAGLECVSVE